MSHQLTSQSTRDEDAILLDRTMIKRKKDRKQLMNQTTKDSTFLNPYFFVRSFSNSQIKRPSSNKGTVNWDHFTHGVDIPDVELVPQMRHYEHHLVRSKNEWKWRDSKTPRSREMGRAMSQDDPIRRPDYYFETRGMKHYPGMIPEPSWILKEANRKDMGNYLMEPRTIRELSPVAEEQQSRNDRFGGIQDVMEGNRRTKVANYPNKPFRTPMKPVVTQEFAKPRPQSADSRAMAIQNTLRQLNTVQPIHAGVY